MELNEACALAAVKPGVSDCNPPNTDTTGWKGVIDGIKGGEGNAATLKANLGQIETPPKYPRPLALGWDLFECGPTTFPTQTHHLVPEKQLPEHTVTQWLTDSPKKKGDAQYELASDTDYDTNGAANGYFMPFASTTHQWAAIPSKQNAVCFEMMRLTGLQLHQGRHSRSSNYLEEALDVDTESYKGQVDELLNEIYTQVHTHAETCDTCKDKSSNPIKVVPLRSTVEMMEQASFLMKTLVRLWRVAVSSRAGAYGVRHYRHGAVHHRTSPFVRESDFV